MHIFSSHIFIKITNHKQCSYWEATFNYKIVEINDCAMMIFLEYMGVIIIYVFFSRGEGVVLKKKNENPFQGINLLDNLNIYSG